ETGVAEMLRDRVGQISPDAAVQQTSLAFQERRGYDGAASSWVVTEFVRALGHTVGDADEPTVTPNDDPAGTTVAATAVAPATAAQAASPPAVPPSQPPVRP